MGKITNNITTCRIITWRTVFFVRFIKPLRHTRSSGAVTVGNDIGKFGSQRNCRLGFISLILND